jgi:transporter family protein
MWIPLILASALLLAFYDVARKQSVNRNAVMPVLFLSTLAGTLFLGALLAVTGEFRDALRLTPHQHLLVFLKALGTTAMWTCVFYAMRSLPLTIVGPIRNSAPLWTLVGGILLYHEVPGWGRAGGMALVLVGYALFTFAGQAEGIHFGRHPGIGLVAIGTLLGAAAALYDKYLLQKLQIPAHAVQFWFAAWLVPLVGSVLLVQRRSGLTRTPFAWRWSIPLVGVLLILSDWCYFHAVAHPDVPISVLSLIRRSSTAVTFVVGAVLFGEGNLRRKAVAMACILAGVAVLCLAK